MMRKLLIFYSHFAPAFKAGGPVQSLVNLVDLLKEDYIFFVVCEACDIGENSILSGITPNVWNDHDQNVKVYYITRKRTMTIRNIFSEINPDSVYINGMFLPVYNWFPLWLGIKQKRKVVLAPRGMLQQGALSIKPLKKKIFLSIFKSLKVAHQVIWHATDIQEHEDILKLFGSQSNVLQAPNVPKIPKRVPIKREKRVGELKLVYLSLITEKKNLSLILKALHMIITPVTLDIYGPISDPEYWKFCQSLMPR